MSLWMVVPERNTILPGGGFFTSRAMKFSPITTRVVLKKSENPTEIFSASAGATQPIRFQNRNRISNRIFQRHMKYSSARDNDLVTLAGDRHGTISMTCATIGCLFTRKQ